MRGLRFHHVGIRVLDRARSEAFYALLGFRVVFATEAGDVVVLRNELGTEINLVVNAEASFDGSNILMDVSEKRAGITHIALQVASITDTEKELRALGIVITEGPVQLGDGWSVFVRDPDRNVLEFRA